MSVVQTLAFGVEIECYVPLSAWGSLPVNGYHASAMGRATLLPESCPAAGWSAERDSSLGQYPSTDANGNRVVAWLAVELVSPKLYGLEGIRAVQAVMRWLRSMGARVNGSCGLHIHVSLPSADTAGVSRLAALMADYQDGWFATTGSRDRAANRYCKGVKGMPHVLHSAWETDRYLSLNLTWWKRGQARVEFRLFAGTLNTNKLAGYVQLALAAVARAFEGAVRVQQSGSQLKPGPVGEFSRLWAALILRGRSRVLLPKSDLAAARRELLRLVRKFAGVADVGRASQE